MSSSPGSFGVGGIKQGGTEHCKMMQRQGGAERDSKSSTERGSASAQDETTDKSVRSDQQRYDSEVNRNNNSISTGHSSGRDDGTEDTKHPHSAQREFEKMNSTGRNPDSVYFSERDR